MCANRADVPMAEADSILVDVLLDDVLDPSIVRDAVEEAIQLIVGSDSHQVRTSSGKSQRRSRNGRGSC